MTLDSFNAFTVTVTHQSVLWKYTITIHPCLKIHIYIVKGHEVYVYLIDTVYMQTNLPDEFSKRTVVII